MESNITSKSNEKVKYIKSLNEKKFRQKYKAFYLEGIKVVKEAINNKAINIQFIAFCKSLVLNNKGGIELIKILEEDNDITKISLSEDIFEYVTDTVSPQGVLAVIDIPKYNLRDLDFNSDILVLDKVQDLGNIGTIIRSADAFDVKNIIAVSGTGDIYSPKVLRATMGSILREKIIYVDEDNLVETFDYIKDKKIKIIGTSLDTNTYLRELKKNQKYCFIVGNEANGISSIAEENCDSLVKIKMSESAESLNVAVATGIVLHEIYKKNS